MAEPIKREQGLMDAFDLFFETSFDITNLSEKRDNAIRNNRCVPPPVGCGGPAKQFRDELSKKDYSITGLCQNCQNAAEEEMK